MKEKERREGKKGDSLGGVLLSDNDKSLLQRWTQMMDRCHEKPQITNHEGVKNKECNVSSHSGVLIGDNTQTALNIKTDKEAMKIQPHEQLTSQVKPNQPALFQPPSNQQPPVLFPVSQRKSQADIVVSISGGLDIMTVTGGFVKNTLKPHSESNGQSGFNCLGNWNGHQLEIRPPQQPQPNRKPQPQTPSFLQPQPDPQPSSQLIPLESFMTKAPTREKNGNEDVRCQSNLNSHPNAPSASASTMEKLCPSVGDKSGPQTTNPLCGPLSVPAQPHPSLGFTDTGQQGPSVAPDIHTVTLQLSKSQVCFRFFKRALLFIVLYIL